MSLEPTHHTNILDSGYVELVDKMGTDKSIIEAARMSTAKGFLGWDPRCSHCGDFLLKPVCPGNPEGGHHKIPGDASLLKYLYDHKHETPFEMCNMVIEVKAPIFVFREWHRHRTQSYNEMSARYVPLPDENYIPSVERLLLNQSLATTNKQAQSSASIILTDDNAEAYRTGLILQYQRDQAFYDHALAMGVPKELARIHLPVGRYSKMRANANLRNWLGFMTLRCDPAAQWEIRQYAWAVANLIEQLFPKTYQLWRMRFSDFV